MASKMQGIGSQQTAHGWLSRRRTSSSPFTWGRDRGNDGFTLVELLIVVAIIPLVVGTISLALLAVFKTQVGVADRLGTSGDAQVVAANFYRDIQNATMFTTNPSPARTTQSPAQCGAGAQILGLQWTNSNPSSLATTVVSYGLTPNGVVSPTQGSEDNLIRYQCSWTQGTTAAPALVSTSIVSYNAPSSLIPSVSGQSCASTCLSGTPWTYGWVDTNGIQAVSLAVNEAAMNTSASDTTCASGVYAFCYTVESAPRHWLLSGAGNSPVSNLVPAEFIGDAITNIAACNSRNPDLMVNGMLVIDSGSTDPATITGGEGRKNNVFATSVNYLNSGGVPANLNPGTPTTPLASAMSDPLANLAAPSTAGLPTYSTLASATATTVRVDGTTYTYVNPGVYNFSLSGSNVVLNSGPFIMNQGIGGSLTSGVGGNFIYLAGGQMNSSQLNLWPMTTGSYAGIGLWLPTTNTTSTSINLGPGSYQIDGITYVPGGDFGWSGTPDIWLGKLLAQSTSCDGGGGGQANIGYTQSLSFSSSAPTNATVGGRYTVTATSASPNSGNPVTYSVDPLSQTGACTVSGNVVRFTGVTTSGGACLVDADQAQSDQTNSGPYKGGYLEAPTIQQSFQIAAAG